jgi:hypothetical protein
VAFLLNRATIKRRLMKFATAIAARRVNRIAEARHSDHACDDGDGEAQGRARARAAPKSERVKLVLFFSVRLSTGAALPPSRLFPETDSQSS